MEKEKHEQVLSNMDATIEWYDAQEPLNTDQAIRNGLDIGVARGEMTIQQAEEYWEAYVSYRNFTHIDRGEMFSHIDHQDCPCAKPAETDEPR